MNKSDFNKLYLKIYFLDSFDFIIQDEVISKFLALLKTIGYSNSLEEILAEYKRFIEILKIKKVDDFNIYLKNAILKRKYQNKSTFHFEKEIEIINMFLYLNFPKIKTYLEENFPNFKDIFSYMIEYQAAETSLCIKDFENTIEEIKDDIFSKHSAFIFDTDFEIKPVETVEKIRFSDLKGYKEQKRILYENTFALLENKKVNNILLYGDAGCGKSTSVRALLNEFKEIKIVQIFKKNLINLDKLYSKLKDLPYKFIIFADDISFDETDDSFSTVKAILEGSLIQCPKNVVIYATSNRRHLVKESFKTRSNDEIHLNDTINEVNSLSERFGINLLFAKPNNEEFNNIVLELAKDNNIDMDEKLLIEKAQRLALIKGSRSPRVAKQLIDNIIAHVSV